jgi:hypothetical protein
MLEVFKPMSIRKLFHSINNLRDPLHFRNLKKSKHMALICSQGLPYFNF